ncbi:MAG: MATE family efflux transporter [Pseudobutyrivibrio sp.]|uniref:MATE family efflux transporter n=1 Tax=Pseudobutyrivibrio sp. TaxID=2014367 RepID=UPI0025F34E20|nr:MATE family efflux transporter [Pseudobutyrivibrio sp.]MBQ6463464.1 MATE family efflux transporter [Pseudobutyrivibrio sp.]
MISDMTKGDTYKVLFKFSLFIAAGNMLQQLYNLADFYILGRYAGVSAMAAVGAASNSVVLLINVAVGMNMGTNVVIATSFGKRSMQQVKNGIKTGILMATVIGIAFTVLGIVFTRWILLVTNTPIELLEEANTYLRIYFYGLVFLFLFNIIIAISQALGDSKTSFCSLIISAIINIILDIYLVKYRNLGVKGAAIATVISEIICLLFGVVMLVKLLCQMDGTQVYKYDFKEQEKIINESIPAVLQRSVIAIGVTLMQSLINRYGINIMAGYTAATKLFSIVSLPVMDIGNAVTIFTAQNMGANKKSRVKEGILAAIVLDVFFSIFILILVFGFGRQIIAFFISSRSNLEAIEFGIRYIRITCVFQIIQGILQVYNGVIRGASDVRGFMGSFTLNLFARVSCGYALAYFLGLRYIPYAWPVGWAVGLATGYMRYAKLFQNARTPTVESKNNR